MTNYKAGRIKAWSCVADDVAKYLDAWQTHMSMPDGEQAAQELGDSCRVLARTFEEAHAAFEKTVPRFGKHQMYLSIPVVRDGPYTRKGKPRQAAQDLDTLFMQARLLNPHFQDWVRSWVGWQDGARHVPGPVKHLRRVIEKCVRIYGRDAAAVTDFVRCTAIFPTMGGVLGFFRRLLQRSDCGGNSMFRLVRVKNRFDVGYDAEAKSAGYRDLSMLVEVGWIDDGSLLNFVPVKEWDEVRASRHICEIQVHLATLHKVKEGSSHANYCRFRDLMAS